LHESSPNHNETVHTYLKAEFIHVFLCSPHWRL